MDKILSLIIFLLIYININFYKYTNAILVEVFNYTEAEHGSTVILICQSNISKPVMWQRRRPYEQDWEYIYQGRPPRIVSDKRDRFSVSVDDRGYWYNLTINNVMFNDIAKYRCIDDEGNGLWMSQKGYDHYVYENELLVIYINLTDYYKTISKIFISLFSITMVIVILLIIVIVKLYRCKYLVLQSKSLNKEKNKEQATVKL